MTREDEFVEFATAAGGRLRNAAYLMTGDRDQAQDAAQTALVRTYAAWHRIRGDPYTYARSVLTHHLIDGWRRPLREYPAAVVPERSHDDVADAVATRHWLVAVLRTLTSRERTIVVLRYYFDLSEDATARELDVSVGTVKSTTSRAFEKLRAGGVLADPDLIGQEGLR